MNLVSINLSAIGTQAAATLTHNAASQAPDGDGDHVVEPTATASASRPQLPANSTISLYA